MAGSRSLIKLAENPDLGYGEDPNDSLGDQGSGDNYKYDDMAESSVEDEMDEGFQKGRAVRGPRTKLNNSEEITAIRRGLGDLAKAVNAIARVQKAILDKGGFDEEEDPMGFPEEDEFGGDEEGFGDEDEFGEEEEMMSLSRTKKSNGSARTGAKVSKDDAAGGSFGEKDSDTPGNRPYDMTSPGEDDTIIQGGPAAGPGPISKGETTITPRQLEAMINRSVQNAMKASGSSRVNKAEAPRVGSQPSSKIEKAVDVEQIFGQTKELSFKQINQMRTDIGDLPDGWV
jgi:hypothetical protein